MDTFRIPHSSFSVSNSYVTVHWLYEAQYQWEEAWKMVVVAWKEMHVCLCVCVDSDHEVNWETRPIITFRVQIARQYLILYEGID